MPHDQHLDAIPKYPPPIHFQGNSQNRSALVSPFFLLVTYAPPSPVLNNNSANRKDTPTSPPAPSILLKSQSSFSFLFSSLCVTRIQRRNLTLLYGNALSNTEKTHQTFCTSIKFTFCTSREYILPQISDRKQLFSMFYERTLRPYGMFYERTLRPNGYFVAVVRKSSRNSLFAGDGMTVGRSLVQRDYRRKANCV